VLGGRRACSFPFGYRTYHSRLEVLPVGTVRTVLLGTSIRTYVASGRLWPAVAGADRRGAIVRRLWPAVAGADRRGAIVRIHGICN
jgi:hypothetical protein